MLQFIIFCTHYSKGQNYPFLGSSPPTLQNNNFIKITPTPSLPFTAPGSSGHTLRFGKSYNPITNRGVFYGGNLGVSQDTAVYGNTAGNWCLTGAYRRGCSPSIGSTVNGLNFQATQHLWGNYDALFGLRADSTADVGNTNFVGKVRNAVIGWSYERANTPNRLIFQTMVGIDDLTNGQDNDEHEWATILSNGNIGSGTSSPTAQFQLKPLNSIGIPLMEMLDASNSPKFTFTKEGNLGLGVSGPNEALDVLGNIHINGKLGINRALTAIGPDFHMSGIAFIEEGTLEIMSLASSAASPLSIVDNLGNPFFSVTDIGNVNVDVGNLSLISGHLFLPSITGTGAFPRILAINATGQVVSGPAPSANTLWEVGTNTFPGIIPYSLGSFSDNDVQFKAGNTLAFTVLGSSSTYKGFTEFNKSVSILTNSDANWALNLKSAGTTAGLQGVLNCVSTAGAPILKVDNAGNMFLPGIAPSGSGQSFVGIDANGQLASMASSNSYWTNTGNTYSGSGSTYSFGTTSNTGGSVYPDDKIEFFAGGLKVFDIWNDFPSSTSQIEEGSTNFCRNVSIQGGSTSTGFSNGNSGLAASTNCNNKLYSLNIQTALNTSHGNYDTKGILMCRDANTNPVISVGAHQVGFFSDFSSTSSSSPTTTFQSYSTIDYVDLMRPQNLGRNIMTVWGSTYVANHILPKKTGLPTGSSLIRNIGSATEEFDNIFSSNLIVSADINAVNINCSNKITSFTVDAGTVIGAVIDGNVTNVDFLLPMNTLGPGTSEIGNTSNHFGNIWGNNIHVDNLLPKTSGVSKIGTSSNFFQEIWTWWGDISGSDIRFKENINPLKYGLKTILSLKPYTYNFKSSNKGLHHGFIAQDLQKIFPNSIVAGEETDTSYLGVRYDEFIPILTLAIQQQQSIIDSLKQKLDFIFVSNQTKEAGKSITQKEDLNQLPLLFQNHPNPFNRVTFIDYFLPDNSTNAFLKVIDNDGKLVKAFPIYKTGFGQIELDCSNLAQGNYYYSLLVNSQIIDTKNMIIAIAD